MPGNVAELNIVVKSDDVKKADTRLKGLTKESKRAETATEKLTRSINRLGGNLKQVVIGYIGFTAALRATKAIVRADQDLAKINNRLIFVTGSAEAARKEFQRLSQRADFFGQDIRTLAQQYGKLAAATRGTTLEGEETRLMFEAVASASATLALGAEDVEGIFRALTQIVSKNVVSMEELRQQLGERVPGAMQAAQRATGKFGKEFDKLVSSGTLLAEDFLPKFSRELLKTFGKDIPGATNTTTAAINRFNNALFQMTTSGGVGFMENFRDALNSLTELIKDPSFQAGMKGLIDLTGVLGEFFVTDPVKGFGL